MNKKGFTLVEIIVSISLVAIILVSMFGSLVKLREAYSIIDENTDAKVYGASITRVISNDVITSGGIRSITCEEDGTSCDFILGNGKKRNLVIYSPDDVVEYIEDDSSNTIGDRITITRTIKYTDTTETGNDKLLLIKSISSIKRTNEENSDFVTFGYHFTRIDTEEYRSENKSDSTKEDVIRKIIIKMSDKKYDLTIYSYTIENVVME